MSHSCLWKLLFKIKRVCPLPCHSHLAGLEGKFCQKNRMKPKRANQKTPTKNPKHDHADDIALESYLQLPTPVPPSFPPRVLVQSCSSAHLVNCAGVHTDKGALSRLHAWFPVFLCRGPSLVGEESSSLCEWELCSPRGGSLGGAGNDGTNRSGNTGRASGPGSLPHNRTCGMKHRETVSVNPQPPQWDAE